MTWIITSYGATRLVKGASQWFAKSARAANIIGKTAHGLRSARAVSLAERGASTHQIAAWTGHESLSEVEHYSRAANKKHILGGAEHERKLSKTAVL